METEPFVEPLVLADSAPRGSRLISRVLSPAIQLWLRSQLEHVEDLHFTIEAGDRELLAGNIQQVAVSAQKAVYRGLHLSQIQIIGQNICTNLRQVIRGKPLRLLAAFPIRGEVRLREDDLNASLVAPLLGDAVVNFLMTLLQGKDSVSDRASTLLQNAHLQSPQVALTAGQLQFAAMLATANGPVTPVRIQACLVVENGNQLRLHNLRWAESDEQIRQNVFHPVEDVTFDLGSHVALTELVLEPGQIRCQGEIMVTPEGTAV